MVIFGYTENVNEIKCVFKKLYSPQCEQCNVKTNFKMTIYGKSKQFGSMNWINENIPEEMKWNEPVAIFPKNFT